MPAQTSLWNQPLVAIKSEFSFLQQLFSISGLSVRQPDTEEQLSESKNSALIERKIFQEIWWKKWKLWGNSDMIISTGKMSETRGVRAPNPHRRILWNKSAGLFNSKYSFKIFFRGWPSKGLHSRMPFPGNQIFPKNILEKSCPNYHSCFKVYVAFVTLS